MRYLFVICAIAILWTAAPFAFAARAEAAGEPISVASADQHPRAETSESGAVDNALANITVIRAAIRDEVSQKPRMMFSDKANVAALLTEIRNQKTGKIERTFVPSTTERAPPKRKVRGAELLPGDYSVSVSCVAFSSSVIRSNSFVLDVVAEAASEYVVECVGYPNFDGRAKWEGMHPVVTRKPLLKIADGVTRLSEACVAMHDVPLWDRMLAPNCVEAKK